MADRDWFDMHRVCGVGTTGFGGRRALPATVAWTFGLGFAALIASSFEAAALPPWGQAKTSPPASTSDTLVSKIAVFGEDNRKRIPKRLDALRGSIGVIYNERSRTVCSAFCVADDVIGIQALRRIHQGGVKRQQLGVILDGDTPTELGFFRHGVYRGEQRVGHLTNCIWSWRLKRNIGFGLVASDCATGDRVVVHKDGQRIEASLVTLPFI